MLPVLRSQKKSTLEQLARAKEKRNNERVRQLEQTIQEIRKMEKRMQDHLEHEGVMRELRKRSAGGSRPGS